MIGILPVVALLTVAVAGVPADDDVTQTSRDADGRESALEEAVTARIEGEHAGSEDLRAVGHFDEDSAPDTAFFRRAPTGTFQLVASLSATSDYEVLAELDSIDTAGVRTVEPGTYQTVCGKGYGGFSCDGPDDSEVRLDRDGVLLFQYESSSQLFYLKDGSFVSAYLSG